MILYGYAPCLAIINVRNHTENVIENITFFYVENQEIHSVVVKKSKPNHTEQTGLSTLQAVNTTLMMTINKKHYVIKEELHRDYANKLYIDIYRIDDKGCSYGVHEGDGE